MRSLKFRAWDKEDKFFIDDGALQFGADGKIYYIYAGLEYGEPELEREDITDEVIVEQYTGLKDKNGKEIYEGDILKFRGRAYEVKFDNYGQFYMENKNYHWLEDGYSFRSVEIWCAEGILVEIIGNIHENPELLEEK